MDEVAGIRDQLNDQSAEPVVLVNLFYVPAADADTLLAAWAGDARYFKARPGFISTQLHRGIASAARS